MSEQTTHHHHHLPRKIRNWKGFRKLSHLYRNSSSHTPLNYPQPYITQNTPNQPIYHTTSPSHGAELSSEIYGHKPTANYSPPREQYDNTAYHYVSMTNNNKKLDESFYEGCSNRSEAMETEGDGLKGVEVLDPSLTTDKTSVSTMQTSPVKRSFLESSPRSLPNLTAQTASCGLQNLGNTCYMNSVLQCLFNIEKLRSYFLQGEHLIGNGDVQLTESFVELLSTVFAKSAPIDDSLMRFKNILETVAPVFEGPTQNDAHEFFRLLIEKIHDELNIGRKKDASYIEFTPSQSRMSIYQLASEWKKYSHDRDNSIITSIFGGNLLNEVICNSCKYVSYTFEDTLDLPLNLSNSSAASSTNSKLSSSLYACLKRFTTPEPVEGYACASCGRKNTSVKRTTIWKQPDTLVVQFKRFVSDNYGQRRALKERVSFPVGTMSLDDFTHENSNESRGRFKLQGIVNHYGELNTGHYIAYLYNDQMGCWLKYNDHNVTKVDPREIEEFGVASVEPYLLFYKRV